MVPIITLAAARFHKRIDRSQLACLLQDARLHRFEAVLVWESLAVDTRVSDYRLGDHDVWSDRAERRARVAPGTKRP